MSSRVLLSKRLFLVNSASAVLRRILYVSVLIWLNQHLLRRVGAVEYSLYPLVVGVMYFVPLLSLFLTAGLGRFVTEAYALGDDEKVTRIVSTMTVPLLVLSGLCLAGGLLFAWHIGHVLTIPSGRLWDARIMLGLLVCCSALRLPLVPFTFGLYVKQRFVLQNLIGLGVEVVKMALLFVLLRGLENTPLRWWDDAVRPVRGGYSAATVLAVIAAGCGSASCPPWGKVRRARSRTACAWASW